MVEEYVNARKIEELIVAHSRSGNYALYAEAREQGMTLSELLDQIDPSQAGLSTNDAFERQMILHNIKPNNTGECFAVSGASVLLPEYLLRSLRQGLTRGDWMRDSFQYFIPKFTKGKIVFTPTKLVEVKRKLTFNYREWRMSRIADLAASFFCLGKSIREEDLSEAVQIGLPQFSNLEIMRFDELSIEVDALFSAVAAGENNA